MFIFWLVVVTGITIAALQWQSNFSKTGQTVKAIFLAIAYTIFAFQFLENHKVVFIFYFFMSLFRCGVWLLHLRRFRSDGRWTRKKNHIINGLDYSLK